MHIFSADFGTATIDPDSVQPAGRIRPRQALGAAAIALAATLPFLNKAIHIDDVLYLQGAARILQGHDAYFGAVLWDAKDGQPSPLFDTDYNPPLWKYVLAAAIAVFGAAEWRLHLVAGAFVALAVFGVLVVSRRLTRHALWVTAMVFLSPFFLPGQNLMLEVPVLCFSIWALEFQLRGMSGNRNIWFWMSGLLFSLAIMTKYTSALLLVLVSVASAIRRRAALVAMIPPAITLVAWLIHNHYLYGRSHIGSHGVAFEPWLWPIRVLIVLRCVGAVTVFGPAIALLLWKAGPKGHRWLSCSLLAAGTCAWLDWRQALAFRESEGWRLSELQDRLQAVHFLLFSFHGSFSVFGMLGIALAAPNRLRSDAWINNQLVLPAMVAFFLFNVVSVPFNAVRHLLFFGVAAVWMIARALDAAAVGHAVRRNLILASAALAYALAFADYEIAGAYRQVARREVTGLVRECSVKGQSVWFTGTWGFAYYSRPGAAGALPWLREPEKHGLPTIQPGDKIVRPELLSWHKLEGPQGLAAKVVDHWQLPAWNPIRTISAGVHYYSVLRHSLPWQLLVTGSDDPAAWYELPDIDEILVYELQRLPPAN